MRENMWIVAVAVSVIFGMWALHRESKKDSLWATMLMAGCTISGMMSGMLFVQTFQRMS
jgi:ABC-type dipeptide/oligopeptide/nickel transport system permease component